MAREPLHSPVHQPSESRALPDFHSMSDAELDAYVAGQEQGSKFEIPYGMEPPGMSYGWKRAEILGRPDYSNLAQCEQRGWKAVPQARHDGFWMTPGTAGPTMSDGLILMEIPTPLLRAKEAYQVRQATAQTDSMTDRLSYAPPGSAPRGTHPSTQAQIRREIVRVEMEVAP